MGTRGWVFSELLRVDAILLIVVVLYGVAPRRVFAYQNVALNDEGASQKLQGTESSSAGSAGLSRRIRVLETRVDELERHATSLQQKNEALRRDLVACGCHPSGTGSCVETGTGRRYRHGMRWAAARCRICRCHTSGNITCHVPNTAECLNPACPCQNGGVCKRGTSQCRCPEGYQGLRCEIEPRSPCNFLPSVGSCNGSETNKTATSRFYYDWNTQSCKSLIYSGCGGTANNFATRQQCTQTCLRGACCIRHVTATSSSQECREHDLASCKRLVRPGSSLEVIAFNPGVSCDHSPCGGPTVNHKLDCTNLCTAECNELHLCRHPPCRCPTSIQRREVRDLSPEDRWRFQRAVSVLRTTSGAPPTPPGAPAGSSNRQNTSTWELLQDLYSRHIMHAYGSHYFLLWHRVFLRLMEQHLEKAALSASDSRQPPISLPYYDFTADSGRFHEAIVWQANFFGGNGGENSNGGCVRHHPFRNSSFLPPNNQRDPQVNHQITHSDDQQWSPCIIRNFNKSVTMPSMLEVAHILQTDEFLELSRNLQALAGYLHSFIGGTMLSANAPYDPIFYSIYAFIDMLFWQWQQRHPQQGLRDWGLDPAQRLEPFGLTLGEALNQAVSCVAYIEAGEGRPCNGSSGRSDIERFTYTGYDTDGFDSIGYDQFGYTKEGYDRDGFNRHGYNRAGYDRYGFGRQGYNRWGYDRNGYNRTGQPDRTKIYQNKVDIFCRNRGGLTVDGYDQYGFRINGLNSKNCGFGFRGPHITYQSARVWAWLKIQSPELISNFGRTCVALDPVNDVWWRQCWIEEAPLITGLIKPYQRPTTSVKDPASNVGRTLCWHVEPYVTSCTCEHAQYVTCRADPCEGATCRAEPEAECVIDVCGSCKAFWVLDGKRVDCVQPSGYCNPNICLNGGTCQPSRWRQRPHQISCRCPPHFEGPRCERQATQVCLLSPNIGTCTKSTLETRWFYDAQSATCRQFQYTGCGGNANNFPTMHHCQQRCVMGACCMRKQIYRGATYGFSVSGVDRYGFTDIGNSTTGLRRTHHNGLGFGEEVFDSHGFNFLGLDREGFDKEGFDSMGYDAQGYNRQGYNVKGYNKLGDFDGDISYNKKGYNEVGLNRAGYTCRGHSHQGLDATRLVAGHEYRCQHTSWVDCQAECECDFSLVSFSPGKTCRQSNCQAKCGCQYGLKTIETGQELTIGCGLMAKCDYNGRLNIKCGTHHRRRKEIRELSTDDWSRFHRVIRNISTVTAQEPSKWSKLTDMFATHYHYFIGKDLMLPWLRYFLHQVETTLQEVDCHVTIPYFDWTIDVGAMMTSQAWQANAFGGTGNDDTACVARHPFQDPSTNGWSPCIRRQFDPAVRLANLLHVQAALRKEDYTLFSQSLTTMSKYFRSFVGGHLNTAYAAYDPVFLSHAAYLDKLWEDWQRRHLMGSFTFPTHLRYAPMAPFGNAPDEVFSSELQLCVRYLDLSFGVPCTRPGPRYPKYPLSVDYDENGYDAEGYDRNGFDDIGFDRHGFGQDGFNRDGFNRLGYDRQGYNRHGLDRNGFTREGTHVNGSRIGNVSLASRLYDSAGFDRYGFNKFGYNRAGYDAFGFDTAGHDKKDCTFYYHGPFYVIQFVNLINYLNDLTVEELLHVPSTCPHLEGLSIFSQVNKPTIHSKHGVPWYALTASNRFCVTPSTHTPCPIGLAVTPCENTNLCTEFLCLQQPGVACWTWGCGGSCMPSWYDLTSGGPVKCSGCTDHAGVVHEDGSTWRPDPCNSCTCNAGVISCGPDPTCPSVTCANAVTLPSACCPSCDACEYGGKVYADGAEIVSFDDPCQSCICRYGNVLCRVVDCFPVPAGCRNVVTPPGECCPQCADCDDTSGREWRDDKCQLCRCQDGTARCEAQPCSPVRCSHPSSPPGTCCPRCEECFHEGRMRANGDTWQPDPCRTCYCHYGNVRCQAESCPAPNCDQPIHIPGQCCSTCKTGCAYSKQHYEEGATFPAPYNSCLQCTCTASRVTCRPISCPAVNLTCQHPVPEPGACCPSKCPDCAHEERTYPHGAEWDSEGGCGRCTCHDGVTSCRSKVTCPNVSCKHGAVPEGQCCPICRDCQYKEQTFPDGSVFTSGLDDSCTECACASGVITCHRPEPCQPITCRNPSKQPGLCCPQCQNCTRGGIIYKDGQEVPSPKECHRCVCFGGETVCRHVACPILTCPDVVQSPGECCPVCSECQYDGAVYRSGEQFISKRDPCQKCTCRNREVICESITCPSTCEAPVAPRPGECCPVCPPTPVEGCKHNGQVYNEGAEVPGPECQICRCSRGSVKCITQECPSTECPYPVPGRCCPSCDEGCMYGNELYPNGGSFPDPRGEPCSRCTCSRGYITCERTPCPDITCSNPATPPGGCCPVCNDCFYEGNLISNGLEFTADSDPCISCKCLSGSVSCLYIDCLQVLCPNPRILPGQCCPVCDTEGCLHNGRSVQEGEVIEGQNACEECRCVRGEIACTVVDCPPVVCMHPVQGKCCARCGDCNYLGRDYREQERFVDPQGSDCSDCLCRGGNVTCGRQSCPPTSCTHPANSGGCCPTCTDCEYKGQIVRHGEVIPSTTDECTECRCSAGSVPCSKVLCPPVSCPNPKPGNCCPECPDYTCHYKNREFRNGEVIPVPGRSCEECKCTQGRIKCARSPCPAVDCVYPMQGECCPTCDGCSFGRQTYNNGESFPDPRGDPCYECTCTGGNVTCGRLECPELSCRDPVSDPDSCCPSCSKGTDCVYDGKIIRDGETINSNTEECKECQCRSGSVTCYRIHCPPVSCPNPTPGRCCPECMVDTSTCHYDGNAFREGEVISISGRSCEECRCMAGQIQCSRVKCAELTCRYPVYGDCCPSCNGCSFGDKDYRHQETFPDPRDPSCHECTCNQGNVSCQHIRCPRPECNHPITLPGKCCPQCTDCLHEGQLVNNGDKVTLAASPCTQCSCDHGSVTCEQLTCPALSCSHPAPPSKGTCCQTCHTCLYHGSVLSHGDRITDPLDPCSQCVCARGSVTCSKRCADVDRRCSHPVPGPCGCMQCGGDCLWEASVVIKDGSRVEDKRDPSCSVCTCKAGSVTCGPRPCGPAECPHPQPGPCGCPECPRHVCHLGDGRHLVEGQEVTDPNDLCNACVCRSGELSCSPVACQSSLSCSHPAPDGCGCPVCINCLYNGQTVATGTSVAKRPDDPCSSCLCENGNIHCTTVRCPPLNCTSPQRLPGLCCSQCLDCEIDGELHHDGDVFPDLKEPCHVCTCKEGTVSCARINCEPVQCSHPARDECCPLCGSDCYYKNQIVKDGEAAYPSPCQKCTCQRGNIHCATVTCPQLTCVKQNHQPGECCPKCSGCDDGGTNQPEGSSWRRESPSCEICICYNGVTMCAPVSCLAPCTRPVSLGPDHCCPLCSGCEFSGVQYGEGESFSPSGLPCDVCQCTGGNLACHKQPCLLDYMCEDGHLLPAAANQCCGTCLKLKTSCGRADVGLVITPTADPCYTCECKAELTFSCHFQTACPTLNCPIDRHVKSPGTCCPRCAVCTIPETNEEVPSGSMWTDSSNPCRNCFCKDGTLECSYIECRPLVCGEGSTLSTPPGSCCPVCTEDKDLDCVYGNVTHELNSRWRIDECTICECGASRQVSCHTQRCPPSDCSVNEAPNLVPGQCCPVCITRPGTCTAFGDPHYTTFDGRLVSFQGTCTYTMSADCQHGNFSVQVKHDDRDTDRAVSWVGQVKLRVNETLVELLSRDRVLVNGGDVTGMLPHTTTPPVVFVERLSGSTLSVYTNIGVKLTWEATSGQVELSVPGSYQGSLCGLCGNFNGFPQDDMTIRGGSVTSSVSSFGNSWMVETDTQCQPASDIETCTEAGYRVKRLANTKCAPIKGELFSACHQVVAPQPYFASCVYDLCACADQETCLCDVMSAYARACAHAGVTVHWRTMGRCSVGCPTDLGLVFDECGPRCPRTCENRQVTHETMTSQCLRPCVPGCQCPAHLVLHHGRCISEMDCPPINFGDLDNEQL